MTKLQQNAVNMYLNISENRKCQKNLITYICFVTSYLVDVELSLCSKSLEISNLFFGERIIVQAYTGGKNIRNLFFSPDLHKYPTFVYHESLLTVFRQETYSSSAGLLRTSFAHHSGGQRPPQKKSHTPNTKRGSRSNSILTGGGVGKVSGGHAHTCSR